MTHFLEATVRLAVEASSEEMAIEVAKEQLKGLEVHFADHLVYEWDDPVIYNGLKQD